MVGCSLLSLYGAGVSHTIAVGLKTGAIKATQSTPKQTSTVNDMSDEHEVDVLVATLLEHILQIVTLIISLAQRFLTNLLTR